MHPQLVTYIYTDRHDDVIVAADYYCCCYYYFLEDICHRGTVRKINVTCHAVVDYGLSAGWLYGCPPQRWR